MLRLLLLYQFWLAEICICHEPHPTRDETHDLQIALSTTLMLPFFYTSGAPHTRHIRTHFKLWGRPFHSSLLASFFLLVLLWKEFNSYSCVVIFRFSPLFSSPLVFYSAGDGCWIHINISCFACIYCTPLIVSLNDKPWLAHRRQQLAGSAFQFHYMIVTLILPNFLMAEDFICLSTFLLLYFDSVLTNIFWSPINFFLQSLKTQRLINQGKQKWFLF